MNNSLKHLLFIFLTVCSLNVKATIVDMTGLISYNRVGGTVTLSVDKIQNIDPLFISGTLHLRMSASTTPTFTGAAYQLADVSLNYINGTGQLIPGESFINVSATTTFNVPPNGVYYIHMYVSEFPDLTTALDQHTFTSLETFGPVLVLPLPPSGLSVTSTTSSSINLNWIDNSLIELGYRVERSTSPSSGFSQIGAVNASNTTYQTTGLSSSTTYYFRVKAFNLDGESTYSNIASGTTSAATSSTTTTTTSSDSGGGGSVSLLGIVLCTLLGFARRKAYF